MQIATYVISCCFVTPNVNHVFNHSDVTGLKAGLKMEFIPFHPHFLNINSQCLCVCKRHCV